MANYTIIATITKVDADEVFIKGVQKYLFEDSQRNLWNILDNQEIPKFVKIDQLYDFNVGEPIWRSIVGLALVNHKPLKLTIEYSSENETYTIIAVENPDAQFQLADGFVMAGNAYVLGCWGYSFAWYAFDGSDWQNS